MWGQFFDTGGTVGDSAESQLDDHANGNDRDNPSPDDSGSSSWSSQNPADAYDLSRALRDMTGMDIDRARLFLNQYAESYYNQTGAWPTAQQMLSDPSFLSGANTVLNPFNILPSVFATVDQDGNLAAWQNTSTGLVPLDTSGFMGGIGGGMATQGLPRFPLSYIQALANGDRPRGGGGIRGPVFDKAALIEAINRGWGDTLIEEAPNASALAEQFIKEASTFARKGGQLQFETWLMNKMRDTTKYGVLYGRKPPEMSEAQYRARYTNTAAQFGLSPGAELEEVRTGLQSGASVQGFSERVAGTRRVQVANQGSLSQGIAGALRGLGSAVRA